MDSTDTSMSNNESTEPAQSTKPLPVRTESLWHTCGGIDVAKQSIFPYLDDRSAVSAMTVNRATVQSFNEYPVKRPFMPTGSTSTRNYHHIPSLPADPNVRCKPRIIRLVQVTSNTLNQIAYTPHLIQLQIELSDEQPVLDFSGLSNLTDLHIHGLNQSISPGSLPSSLIKLSIAGSEDNRMDSWIKDQADNESQGFIFAPGCFPRSIKKLQLSHYPLSCPIAPHVLPESLTHLEYSCNQELLPGILPPLKELDLLWTYNFPLKHQLLPNSLKRLQLGYDFNQRIAPGVLNEGLEQLKLSDLYMEPFEPGALPASLIALLLECKYFNHPIKPGTFPPNSEMRGLVFQYECRHFNQPFKVGSLPNTLEEIDLTGAMSFNQPFRKGVLPSALQILRLGMSWNQPLVSAMFESCPGLVDFSLSECEQFRRPIGPYALPARLQGFHLPWRYEQPIKASVLPPTLKLLQISDPRLVKGRLPGSCKLATGDTGSDEDGSDVEFDDPNASDDDEDDEDDDDDDEDDEDFDDDGYDWFPSEEGMTAPGSSSFMAAMMSSLAQQGDEDFDDEDYDDEEEEGEVDGSWVEDEEKINNLLRTADAQGPEVAALIREVIDAQRRKNLEDQTRRS